MSDRTLATVETIKALTSIDGADAIEAATVRGWTVVVKKGEFEVGDPVLYIEVDAALPLDDPRFAFLAARGTKTYQDRQVHVLKTARLRGVYSQGIAFPLADFPEALWAQDGAGKTLDTHLGITKWEPPLPAGMAAVAPFPSFLVTTDAERVQNLDDNTWASIQVDPTAWLATEKVDGSSLTAWVTADGALHVASRNWELDPAVDNAHWRMARAHLSDLMPGQWVQGEVVGPGMQGNPLGLPAERFVVFGMGTFDVSSPALETTHRTSRDEWPDNLSALAAPVYDMALPATIAETIAQVEKIGSLLAPGRAAEGVVWTRQDGVGLPGLALRAVFKSISAAYLAKQAKRGNH